MSDGKSISGKKYRVALFGAGKMALHHAKAIQLQENAILVAAADPELANRKKLHDFGKEIEVYTSAENLLDSIKPDVVHICTPPSTHAVLAKLALRHGSHVYVEKPFTLRANEAKEVVSLAEEKGLKVCAGHQLLYESPALRADENLRMLGQIVHIESYFSFKPVRRSRDGRTAISPLDQLVDILPHPVYLLLNFLKKSQQEEDAPIQIRALEVSTAGSVHGILRLRTVTGTLTVTLEGRPIESYVKVVGTNGCLHADFVLGTITLLPGPGISAIAKILNPYRKSWQIASETTRALFRRVFKKQKSYPGLFEIIRSFYGSLEGRMPDAVSHASIMETVSICEEAEKKLRMNEEAENVITLEEHKRKESELPPPDIARGGVLITGGTGMLGKAAASELRRSNWFTRVVARKIPSVSARVPGVEYVAVDLAENVPSEIFRDISTVVHCAAETAGGREAHARNSVDSTGNILKAMSKSGVRKFIHVSSIAVLKGSQETGRSVDEDTPIVLDDEERGPYVWGKAVSERLARETGSALGIHVRVIRPGPLVNYDDFEPPGRLGREIGPYFIMIGSRSSKLSLCSVETGAEIIKKFVEQFESMPAVLNLIEEGSPTRGELVAMLLKRRPDLKVLRLPSGVLRAFSPALKAIQRIVLPGRKPVDVYAAFASERYNSTLATKIIQGEYISPRAGIGTG